MNMFTWKMIKILTKYPLTPFPGHIYLRLLWQPFLVNQKKAAAMAAKGGGSSLLWSANVVFFVVLVASSAGAASLDKKRAKVRYFI